MGIWYCTREDVKSALDSKATAYNNKDVDAAIEQASRNAEGLLHRRYYPEMATRTFDWPNQYYAPSWRLYLRNNELISLTTLVSGGITVPPTGYFLRRSDNVDYPPYTFIDINLASSSAFSGGSTFQRSIVATGLYGYHDTQTDIGGTLATTINSSTATVDVTNSADIGVGSLLNLELERVTISARSLLTTATTINADMGALNSVVSASVTDGTKHHEGELITIDAETMIVRGIAGNTLIVQRAWDGSVLAQHTSGATVYAPRRLTAVRAALGTMAAAHNAGISITRQTYPGPVVSLARAYAINNRLQEVAGYARVAGSGNNAYEFTGRGIIQLEQDAYQSVGRRNRLGAI